MKQILVVSLASFFLFSCNGTPSEIRQSTGFEALSGPYFGQESPGAVPRLFMPGLVSTHDLEGCVGFLDGGKVLVFYKALEGLQYTYEKNGRWTPPERAPFQNQGITDFTAGPDGKTLYFQSDRPVRPDDETDDTNTWAVEWTGSSWTDPHLLPPPANTDSNESFPSLTDDGSLYIFTGRREGSRLGDIYRSLFIENAYLEIERLGFPINTDYHEVDPFVAPDGSYLLFGSGRPGGYGTTDLYVSFLRDDGSWTHPHNAGNVINPFITPVRMSVTPDGKYFFFLSDYPTELDKGEKVKSDRAERYGDTDVYWVETGFIETIKQNILHKQCAAEAVRNAYRSDGVQSAIDTLADLYQDRQDTHYFELSELLMLCGEMMAAGNARDAQQFYKALLETLPDTYRIRLSYAVANILNGNTATGLDLLRAHWRQFPSAKSEGSMGILSHYLSSYSKTEDELLLLKFCTTEFPDSYDAFFNLAQAHVRLGNRVEALQACRKSLELKPDFTDAAELLEELEP
jgi:hypothetical protein